MRTVSYDDVPDQPWRNGGGTTRELHRDGRWRLSIATITAPGEFSVFPGVDRTFVVARGRLVLTVAGVAHPLGPGDLLRFAGEDVVTAAPDGEVTAVNVMANRPHRADVRVGEPGTAEAVVDLATLQAHFAVAPGDVRARGVVVEGIS
ncbi:HutD/Ves family protein [Kineococcus sp. SYSU DK003]|uniref:HutD/Ves family protein n=1 Tax=Kineococcus sp. SYSU DK003 TaxID=3383124 RepID=UPI003D7D61D7